MNHKKTLSVLLIASAPFSATKALSDPVEGMWKRPNGILVKFSPCGDSYCATQVSGARAGDKAGKLTPAGGGKYALAVTDPKTGGSATGTGTLSGTTLTISGCVLGGLLCKTENWARQ